MESVDTVYEVSYFIKTGDLEYDATEHTGGAWNPEEQHVAPAMGLMTHVLESTSDEDAPGLQPVRLSFDILGTIPVGPVQLRTETLRRGRTIALREVHLHAHGRTAIRLRAWFMAEFDTTAIQGVGYPSMQAPEQMPAYDPRSDWPGGFIASLEGRRGSYEPGRAQAWLRTEHPLVENEDVSDFSAYCALLDTANGVAVRARPTEVAFPNLDLTASFFRRPQAGWIGYDTTVSYGATGHGLTESVIHDEHGPVGLVTQSLTVRPMP